MFKLKFLKAVFMLVVAFVTVGGTVSPALAGQSAGTDSLRWLYGSGSATGGKVISLRVTLWTEAPAGGAVVALKSNSPVITVPATATIPAGSTQTIVKIKTLAVHENTPVTITATYKNRVRTKQILILRPYLSSTTIQSRIRSGGLARFTVRLSGIAPEGGVTVRFNSNRPSAVPVPATLYFPAGKASVTYIATGAVVHRDVELNISAKYRGVTITKPTILRKARVTTEDPGTGTGGGVDQGDGGNDGSVGENPGDGSDNGDGGNVGENPGGDNPGDNGGDTGNDDGNNQGGDDQNGDNQGGDEQGDNTGGDQNGGDQGGDTGNQDGGSNDGGQTGGDQGDDQNGDTGGDQGGDTGSDDQGQNQDGNDQGGDDQGQNQDGDDQGQNQDGDSQGDNQGGDQQGDDQSGNADGGQGGDEQGDNGQGSDEQTNPGGDQAGEGDNGSTDEQPVITPDSENVSVCHATGKGTYRLVTANAAGIYNGHYGDHDDIIPAFTYKGVTYPAQNMDGAYLVIYQNGCSTAP
jgi:hypothetical protein